MKILVVAVVLIFALSAMAFAGVNVDAKCAIHVRAHNAKDGCTVNIVNCADINTTEHG
jgi:type 1 fimbria pilin